MKRLLATATSSIAALTIGFAANAAQVSYFLDSNYVDVGGEGTNQRADLVGSGNTVTDFSGIDDASWSAALTSADALVIPELEVDALSGDLSAATNANILSFVNGGGNLVVTNAFDSNQDDSLTLLNNIFGFSLVGNDSGSGDFNLSAAAAGTGFAGGAATLPSANAVNGVSVASLSGSMFNIYSNVDESAVFTTAFGMGNITFLGYDWFGGQDSEWAVVQDIAVNLGGNAAPVPVPGALVLMLAGMSGIAATKRKRAQ